MIDLPWTAEELTVWILEHQAELKGRTIADYAVVQESTTLTSYGIRSCVNECVIHWCRESSDRITYREVDTEILVYLAGIPACVVSQSAAADRGILAWVVMKGQLIHD